jgi:hypothetical protein
MRLFKVMLSLATPMRKTVPQMGTGRLPSISLSTRYILISLLFDAKQSGILELVVK